LEAPDHRLDPYRRGIGRLRDGGDEVGYLTTSVRTWWTQSGPFYARRHVDPVERADWQIFWTRQPAWCSMEFLDGLTDDVDRDVADWSQGEFRLLGHTLGVEWLSGTEAEQLLVEYPVPTPEGPVAE
jgi:hypothetical protein